jgi:hypothetical protein
MPVSYAASPEHDSRASGARCDRASPGRPAIRSDWPSSVAGQTKKSGRVRHSKAPGEVAEGEGLGAGRGGRGIGRGSAEALSADGRGAAWPVEGRVRRAEFRPPEWFTRVTSLGRGRRSVFLEHPHLRRRRGLLVVSSSQDGAVPVRRIARGG